MSFLVDLRVKEADVLQCSRLQDTICERCKSRPDPLLSSPLRDHQLCWRGGFGDYEATFFPGTIGSSHCVNPLTGTEFMHSHLRKSKIEYLISEYTTGFLDTVLVVQVSTGSVFSPLKLHTNTFHPRTSKLLHQSILTPPKADKAPQLVLMASVPVGILGLCVSDMRRKCKIHVEQMVANPRWAH
jgi:hypothetical protein